MTDATPLEPVLPQSADVLPPERSHAPGQLIVLARRRYLSARSSSLSSLPVPDIQDAISLIESGEPREAAALLEKLAAEMPGYATARVLLARSYERLNEWQPALRAWREAHQIIPNSPVVRRGLERTARKASSRSPIESPSTPPARGAAESTAGEAAASRPEKLGDHQHTTAREAQHQAAGASESLEWRPAGLESDEATASPQRPDEAPPTEDDVAQTDATHEERVADRAAEYSDLDRLISELESARIVPRPDLESVPPPDLEDDIEDVVSETLARIYASQGQYDEAAHVYELLAEKQPEKAGEFADKASEMRTRASEQG